LQQTGKDVWIDWEDIPYSSKWWDEITEAIQGTSTFICVLSPDYFNSQTCKEEISLAAKLNKRIIPTLHREFDPQLNDNNSISKINWVLFRDKDDFQASFKKLIATINQDLEWTKFHTRLLVRAIEWSDRNNDSSYHLYGKDLEEAQRFEEQEANKTPPLTTLQRNYIRSSQSGAANLQKKQLLGFYLAALIYSFAQMFVIYIWGQDDLSETAMIKLSWVWLPALSFAIAGLTIGKFSIKKSFIAMGIVAVLFFLFFEMLWPSL
jgi:hypothetical protein